MTPPRFTLMPVLVLLAGGVGCDSVVKIDVDCDRLCLASPGPTIPAQPALLVDAGASSWDGGLAGSWAAWDAASLPAMPGIHNDTANPQCKLPGKGAGSQLTPLSGRRL